ncbi:Prolyl 4-hydroxylase subunit alpha-1 [Thelohanellus kitauei]|uniref:Prolyl 4-hydroxylase subunit alpha-1 n=1 Tax=Thelohanellus kitauei TaxID=669202 RepID=A0A0C2N9C6_THEKT|nr:Prolyl 4-hydroxylase subunit alpha-1 [Thelohanellus kitauei]
MASEKDILHFKMEAYDELKTSTVHNLKTGKLQTAKYRITQSSWLDKYHDSVTRRMKAKVIVATDLTLESAEEFQVANYGMGGFYDTHFDFSRKNDHTRKGEYDLRNGKRLATYLLYMSDVAVGGDTGFPRLGTSIKCSKGDALFWTNLLPDGTGDGRTRHLACPVVLGTKWGTTYL